jgi:hypothetical protein
LRKFQLLTQDNQTYTIKADWYKVTSLGIGFYKEKTGESRKSGWFGGHAPPLLHNNLVAYFEKVKWVQEIKSND